MHRHIISTNKVPIRNWLYFVHIISLPTSSKVSNGKTLRTHLATRIQPRYVKSSQMWLHPIPLVISDRCYHPLRLPHSLNTCYLVASITSLMLIQGTVWSCKPS